MIGPIPSQAVGFARSAGESIFPHLWPGLKCSYAPCLGIAGRNIPDVSPSNYSTWGLTGTAMTVVSSPIGPAIHYAGNSAHQQTAASWGLPCKVCAYTSDDAVFIETVFKFVHSGSAKESTIFWSDNPTIGTPNFYGYRLYVDNNTDKLKLMIGDNDDNAITLPCYYTSRTTLTADRWYHAVVGFVPLWTGDASIGQVCQMWIDGLQEFPTIANPESYCLHLNTQHARVGSTLGSVAPDLAVALVNIWNRELIGHEIGQLYADPLAMFRHAGWAG